jgi:hypothetical protein
MTKKRGQQKAMADVSPRKTFDHRLCCPQSPDPSVFGAVNSR